MRKLILHIGYPKCASTTMQVALRHHCLKRGRQNFPEFLVVRNLAHAEYAVRKNISNKIILSDESFTFLGVNMLFDKNFTEMNTDKKFNVFQKRFISRINKLRELDIDKKIIISHRNAGDFISSFYREIVRGGAFSGRYGFFVENFIDFFEIYLNHKKIEELIKNIDDDFEIDFIDMELLKCDNVEWRKKFSTVFENDMNYIKIGQYRRSLSPESTEFFRMFFKFIDKNLPIAIHNYHLQGLANAVSDLEEMKCGDSRKKIMRCIDLILKSSEKSLRMTNYLNRKYVIDPDTECVNSKLNAFSIKMRALNNRYQT